MRLLIEKRARATKGGWRPRSTEKGMPEGRVLRILPHPSKPGREIVIHATRAPRERRV